MADAIDWDGIAREASELLREYIRIDTSNPPGNEARAVEFLSGLLAAEGIAFETADSAPGRSNLYARMGEASGSVCLLNHTDVVPVERDYWECDPFAGELRDGFIYGRGALDMKGMGIIELLTFILVKRQGLALRRGLVFIAAADEEAGSAFGVSWIEQHREAWMESALVINEGSYGLTGLGGKDTPLFQIATSEKIPFWVKLTVKGRPGHGSVPHGDNCAEHLVRALERVAAWHQDLRVTPLMRAHAEAVRRSGLMQGDDDQALLNSAERSPWLRARLSNTVALTTFNTGIKVNVIPAVATATLDCRLLPDVDADAFLEDLKGVIADERVSYEILNRYAGGESELESEFTRVVREVIAELVEGAHLAPDLTSGFTDSRIYRARGVAAYGFVPCLVNPEDLAGVHGHNERIGVENLRLGIQVLYEVVRRLCAR